MGAFGPVRPILPYLIPVLALVIAAPSALAGQTKIAADPPALCAACAGMNRPQDPFRIYGNSYYVGTASLSSILIVTDEGLILLDGALPQSVPLIARNIEALGFDVGDIRFILNSHAHFDHAGGIAALQRASGATVVASPRGAQALRSGGPPADDPQYGMPAVEKLYPPVPDVQVVQDGGTITLGGVAVTAHLTPGHTPGGTSWTWRSCEGERCLSIAYADSLSAVSAPGFRFSRDEAHPSAGAAFERSIKAVAALPCDILLAPHPRVIGLADKLKRREADPQANPFVDAGACARYAWAAQAGLERRLRAEADAAAGK
jgi:metallo-beta-lactamase class B